MILCRPDVGSVLAALGDALGFLPRTRRQVQRQHRLVEAAYNWEDVAARTEKVYTFVREEVPPESFFLRLLKTVRCGTFMGPIYCCVLALHLLYYKALQIIQPNVQLAWEK
mmetsp:Transcript_17902/g.40296  ORF Transcript_17902/g.40296 Transcript_17902/m.40296 type:complete len:111 (+) Transcript_17902:3-335(+)